MFFCSIFCPLRNNFSNSLLGIVKKELLNEVSCFLKHIVIRIVNLTSFSHQQTFLAQIIGNFFDTFFCYFFCPLRNKFLSAQIIRSLLLNIFLSPMMHCHHKYCLLMILPYSWLVLNLLNVALWCCPFRNAKCPLRNTQMFLMLWRSNYGLF